MLIDEFLRQYLASPQFLGAAIIEFISKTYTEQIFFIMHDLIDVYPFFWLQNLSEQQFAIDEEPYSFA